MNSQYTKLRVETDDERTVLPIRVDMKRNITFEEDDDDEVTVSFSPLHASSTITTFDSINVIEGGDQNNNYSYIDPMANTPLSNNNGEISFDIWKLDTCCLPISYMMVGAFQGLSSGVMTVFLLQIGATEAQQLTIKTFRSLPAILKLFFGFLSDSTPLLGYRRKGYMVIGWAISSLSMFGLTMCGTQNIPLISLFYFCFGLGFWMADVISDSIMVEKAKYETGSEKGQLSSRCYSYRFLMNMITITIVTFTYDSISVNAVFYTLACLPWLIMMPAIYYMHEERYKPVAHITVQIQEIWTTVCSQAVWQPMAFVYLYQLFQIGNGAWVQYLYTELHFSSLQINSFSVIAYILLYCGVQVYRSFMITWNWQFIYVSIACFSILVSIMQIMLLSGVNRSWGISDYIFALGDEAFGDFLNGIQFLPTILMMTHLCPTGSEGASFAMFTTVNNSAMLLASTISSLLLGIWDVSKDALAKGDNSGMIKLTVLTSFLQLFPILFIQFMPKGPEDMKRLLFGIQSSIGGGVFVFVIFTSIMWVIANGLLNILLPGWSGAS